MTMKKIIIGLVIGLVASFALAAKAAPSFFSRVSLNNATATTTATYMTPGTGTSTISYVSSDVDSAYLFINLTASTTATVLNWKYQYSNNNVDWYDEDSVASSVALGQSTYDHASTTVTHVWTPGNATASTTRKMIKMPEVAAGWSRVVFSIPAGSANGTLYSEITAKRNAQ